jgi:hypothetical protein
LLRWNRSRVSAKRGECLSERFEGHQGQTGDRAKTPKIRAELFFWRARGGPKARFGARNPTSKAAKAHAFLGNDRATLSTHAGFKAISIGQSLKTP